MKIFAALRDKNYRFLLVSQAFSDFGDWMAIPIFAALISYEWGLGIYELTILAMCMAFPSVLIGLLSGSVVDKSSPKGVMLTCDAIRAVCAFSMIFIQSFYALLPFIIIEAIARTFFLPAKQVVIKSIVEKENLLSANSLSHTVNQIAKVASPALGGIMLFYWSYKIIFFVNALTFIISALFIAFIAEIKRELTPQEKVLNLAKQSLDFILHNSFIKTIIFLMGLRFAVIFLYDGFFVVLTKEIGMNVAQYGILISMIAVGSIIGAPIVSNFGVSKKTSILCMIYGQFFGGILIILSIYLNLLNNFYHITFLLIWLLFGITNAFINISYVTSLQISVDKAMIGRVFSIGESLQNFFMIIGPLCGYIIVSYFNAQSLFLFCGLLLLMVGVYFMVNMYFRENKWKNILGI